MLNPTLTPSSASRSRRGFTGPSQDVDAWAEVEVAASRDADGVSVETCAKRCGPRAWNYGEEYGEKGTRMRVGWEED